jgi:PAS domain S-box-containing protein
VSAEAFLAAVVATSDDAIFGQDADGSVTSWNSAAERLFGYETSEIVGRPVDTLFPGHLRDDVNAVLITALAGDRVDHFETEVARKDGMPIPISLSICPVVGAAGKPVVAVVVARAVPLCLARSPLRHR